MNFRVVGILSLLAFTLACGTSAATLPPKISTATPAPQQASTAPSAAPPVKPTDAPASQIAKVGDTVEQGGYVFTVKSVSTGDSAGEFLKAKDGDTLVFLDVLIESKSAKGVNVNPLFASLKDSDGYSYTADLMGKDPALASKNDMPVGDKMRGWLTFEIPKTAKGLVLDYNDFSTDIRVQLGM